jgi:hypothetical protein
MDRGRNPGRRSTRPRGVEARHPDVYVRPSKEAGAIVCPDCGVVQHQGRSTFGAPPLTELRSGRCPACQRIADRYPAGTLHVPAKFLAHRDEVVNLIRNVEANEKAEHPLERIMGIDEVGGRMTVTTTGVHLARKIAHKLARRFHCKARFHYADQEDLLEVDWE